MSLTPVIKYLQTTVGRDKVNRGAAYFSKYVLWQLKQWAGVKIERLSADAEKETIARVKKFNKTVGTARKMMRIGRPLEYVDALLQAPGINDGVARLATVVKNTGLTGWLYYDMWQWFAAAGVWLDPDADATKRIGAKYWLVGLAAGLFLNVYAYANVATQIADMTRRRDNGDQDAQAQLTGLHKKLAKLKMSIFKGCLDILVPLQRLDIVPLSDGFIGLSATFTSLLGIRDQWVKVNGKKKL